MKGILSSRETFEDSVEEENSIPRKKKWEEMCSWDVFHEVDTR